MCIQKDSNDPWPWQFIKRIVMRQVGTLRAHKIPIETHRRGHNIQCVGPKRTDWANVCGWNVHGPGQTHGCAWFHSSEVQGNFYKVHGGPIPKNPRTHSPPKKTDQNRQKLIKIDALQQSTVNAGGFRVKKRPLCWSFYRDLERKLGKGMRWEKPRFFTEWKQKTFGESRFW